MDLSQRSAFAAGLLPQIGVRVLKWWPVKMLGTGLGMVVFFFAYFWVLRNPLFSVTIMPLTPVDRLIGFQPGALSLYLSLWFYVSLAPALLIDRHELVSYGAAVIVLSVIGLVLFLVWPTSVPRPDIDWSQYPSYIFLKSVDASGNACPSLHVGFAVFTAVWFERLLRQMKTGRLARLLNAFWCLGILYSTIATRQHVSLDVLAGAGLGFGVVTVHLRYLSMRKGNAI